MKGVPLRGRADVSQVRDVEGIRDEVLARWMINGKYSEYYIVTRVHGFECDMPFWYLAKLCKWAS